MHVMTVPQTLYFLRGQIDYFLRRHVCIHAAASPGEDLQSFAADENLPVHPIKMNRRVTPVADIVALWQLWRLMRRVRPHIVHSHTPKGGLLGMLAAGLAGTPVRIYHMRGLPLMTARGTRRRLLTATERISCGLAQRVLCVSQSLADYAVEQRICRADKIRVLCCGSGNGVDARLRFTPNRFDLHTRCRIRRQLGIPEEATVVGFVGRMVRDKGIVELVSAWRRLQKDYPQAYLLLVGRTDLNDPLPAEVTEQLKCDPSIRLTGPVEEPAGLYAVMDVVALPTYREGFPNVPLEAAAMQLPVVATRVPGCVDAVQDGVTGTLVPAQCVGDLSVAISRYLADARLRDRHGRAARGRVLRDFRPERIWEAVQQQYNELLQRKQLSLPRCEEPATNRASAVACLTGLSMSERPKTLLPQRKG